MDPSANSPACELATPTLSALEWAAQPQQLRVSSTELDEIRAKLAAQGAPCAYAAAACTGTANTCASYASMFTCTSQAGCTWQ